MSTSDLLRSLDLPTTVRRLANGLTVVVREQRRSPVVALVTRVRAGYLDESDAQVGISHVLEHMYFKGTSRRGPGQIARETKDAGGYLNASTSYDHTRYYTVLPADALEQGMDVQADALRDSIVDADELRRELRVIIEEARRKRDTPTAFARESMYATLFDVHRMRRWRIGTEEQLSTYDRDAVWNFYRRWYQPENIVVAITGAADVDYALDLAERHYGALPAGERPVEPAPVEPIRAGFRYRTFAGEVTRTYIEAGWRGVAIDHEDAPALAMLASVLGSGRASRLYRSVREPGHALAVRASSFATRDIGVFGIAAETAVGAVEPALRAIGRTLTELRAEAVSERELARVRRMLTATALGQLETVQGQANFLADWQDRGDWRDGVQWLQSALSVDAEALTRIVRERLGPDQAAVVLYAPNDADVPDATLAATALASPVSNGARPVEEALVVPASRPAGLEREEDDVRFYDAAHARIAVQRLGSGLATLVITMPGGAVEETARTAGFTSLAMRLTTKGTLRRDADEIARATESLGGVVSAHAYEDRFEWRITVPASAVVPALALLGEIAFEPAFNEDVVERERRMLLHDVARTRDDMYQYPLRMLLELAWPGHPYGFGIETVEASLEEADPTAIRDWYRTRIQRFPWVVVVGDVDADHVAGVAAALPAPGGPAGIHAPTPTWPTEVREAVVERQRAQTAIAIGLPGPDRADEDRYALAIAGEAVAGLGGRVFEELRSRRSLAYTVSLRTHLRKRAGAFVGYIATSPEREAEARSELLSEMMRLASAGVDDADLERARRYALGGRAIRRQTTAAVASELVIALVLGRGVEELRTYADRIMAVTPDAVRVAAKRWFDPDRVMTGVVRGRTG